MTSKCKEKEKTTLDSIQTCGYTMLNAFINLKSTKCLSILVISMSTIVKHNFFIRANGCLENILTHWLINFNIALKREPNMDD